MPVTTSAEPNDQRSLESMSPREAVMGTHSSVPSESAGRP
jgi:hypothetical protein